MELSEAEAESKRLRNEYKLQRLTLERLAKRFRPVDENSEVRAPYFIILAYQETLKPPRCPRNYFPRQDSKESEWQRCFVSPENPRGWTPRAMDREFRGRFRLPRELFWIMISEFKEGGYFRNMEELPEDERVAGVAPKPFPLKVLAALAFLAGTGSFRLISDCTYISQSTQEKFLADFVEVGGIQLFEKYVTFPTDDERRQQQEKMEAAGLPGCYCATDGFELKRFCVAANMKNVNLGKKETGMGFNLSATYDQRIIALAGGFPGSWNDISKGERDSLLIQMQKLEIPDSRFTVSKLDGTTTELYGLWSLVDNGYQNVPHLIPPPTFLSDSIDVVFSKWMESVRKLVECTSQFHVYSRT